MTAHIFGSTAMLLPNKFAKMTLCKVWEGERV